MQVRFFVDSGQKRGMGHVRRCLSLAHALARVGAQCSFYLEPDTVFRGLIAASGYPVEMLSQPFDRSLDGYRPDWHEVTIVDSYFISEADLLSLRRRVAFMVVFDDLGRQFGGADLVISPVPAHGRNSCNSDRQRVLTGLEYVLLHPAFTRLAQRIVSDTVQRVLVTTGATDQLRFLEVLLPHLRAVLPADVVIQAVLGPSFPGEYVASLVSSGLDVEWLHAPPAMADAMLGADIAITAGGQTVYELAATGTPAIAVEVADNQQENIRRLCELGLVLSGGVASDAQTPARVASQVAALIANPALRRQMACKGQATIDGQGAYRIAEIIRSYCEGTKA